jgi:hypothetical protein
LESSSAVDGIETLVVAPGVTLKVVEKEMAGTVTVPDVAVLPEMKRKRVPGPALASVALLSKATQKSVPWDEGTGELSATGPLASPTTPTMENPTRAALMVINTLIDRNHPRPWGRE